MNPEYYESYKNLKKELATFCGFIRKVHNKDIPNGLCYKIYLKSQLFLDVLYNKKLLMPQSLEMELDFETGTKHSETCSIEFIYEFGRVCFSKLHFNQVSCKSNDGDQIYMTFDEFYKRIDGIIVDMGGVK